MSKQILCNLVETHINLLLRFNCFDAGFLHANACLLAAFVLCKGRLYIRRLSAVCQQNVVSKKDFIVWDYGTVKKQLKTVLYSKH